MKIHLGTRWRLSGQLTAPAALPRYPFYRKLNGSQSCSGRSGQEKNTCPYRESNFGRPALEVFTRLVLRKQQQQHMLIFFVFHKVQSPAFPQYLDLSSAFLILPPITVWNLDGQPPAVVYSYISTPTSHCQILIWVFSPHREFLFMKFSGFNQTTLGTQSTTPVHSYRENLQMRFPYKGSPMRSSGRSS